MATESRDQTEARDLLLEQAMRLESASTDPVARTFAGAVREYLRAEKDEHARAMAVVEKALSWVEAERMSAGGRLYSTLAAECVAQGFIDGDGNRKDPSSV
jgi:hypothetical protein